MATSSSSHRFFLVLLIGLLTAVAWSASKSSGDADEISTEACSANDPESCMEDALTMFQLRGGLLQPDSVDAGKEVARGDNAMGHRADVEDMTPQLNLMQGLLKEYSEGKKVPAAIGGFVTEIKKQAVNVQKKVKAEHDLRVTDVKASYAAVHACDAKFQEDLKPIIGDDSTSLKSIAKASTDRHCACRGKEAQAMIDTNGCSDELKCLKDDMDAKKLKRDALMSSTVDHCESCSSTGWKAKGGADDVAKMTQWFADKKVECARHWSSKASTFDGLKDDYNAGKIKYGNLAERCEGLDGTLQDWKTWCGGNQTRASMDQCDYRAKNEDACDSYKACRDATEAEWTSIKAIQTKDSADRQLSWVAVEQILCITEVFLIPSGGGDVSIDASKGAECSKKTCKGAADCEALSMTALLSKPLKERLPCLLPPANCKAAEGEKDYWSPSCSVGVQRDWDKADGGYTPHYEVGSRTPAEGCDGTPKPVSRVGKAPHSECMTCEEHAAAAEEATAVTVKSDGSKQKPHVSWWYRCTWDAATQAATATALCKASGYASGTFVSASNDPCKVSFTHVPHWHYAVDQKKLVYGNMIKDAQVVASCEPEEESSALEESGAVEDFADETKYEEVVGNNLAEE